MVSLKKSVAGLFCIGLQVTAHEILPEEFDFAESLSLLQLRSHKVQEEAQGHEMDHSQALQMGIGQVASNQRCSGNYAKRQTFDTVEACAAAWAGQGVKYLAFWSQTQNPARLRGLCIGWTSQNCNQQSTGAGKFNTLYTCSEDDEAAAVGDPHLTLSDGTKEDMCCDNGPCRPCDALLQELEMGIGQIANNQRCSGTYAKRETFDNVEACAAAWAGQNIKYLAYWKKNAPNPARLRGLCIGWTNENCNLQSTGRNKVKLFKCEDDDDAAAVGDPHLTNSGGAKQDLCCDGGECHPCQ